MEIIINVMVNGATKKLNDQLKLNIVTCRYESLRINPQPYVNVPNFNMDL